MKRQRLALVGAGLLAAGGLHAQQSTPRAAQSVASELPPQLALVHAAPSDDAQSTLSPDGRYLAFAAREGGASDVYLLDLQKPLQPPVPVSTGPARDTAPAFSPDGRWVALATTREDAFGDVAFWRVRNGQLLIHHTPGLAESAPFWDGASLLATREEYSGGGAVIAFGNPGDGITPAPRPGTQPFEPDWVSSPVLGDGDFLSAVNAPAPRPGLLARFADDTNGDGVIDMRDDASLWERDGEGRWLQSTPPLRGLSWPARAAGVTVFTMGEPGAGEIVRLAGDFPVASLGTADEALEAARELDGRTPLAVFEITAAGRRAFVLGPDSEAGQRGALVAADALRRNGRPFQANALVATVAGAGAVPSLETAVAWRGALLRAESTALRASTAGEASAARREGAAALGVLREQLAPTDGEWDRILTEEAGLLLAAGSPSEAVGVLGRSNWREAVAPGGDAAARLAIAEAEALAALGAPSEAARAAIDVARAFQGRYDVSDEAALAAVRWFAEARAPGEDADAAALAYRSAADSSGGLPSILAAAHLLEGDAYARAGRTEAARAAWGRAARLDEAEPRLAARASFALAGNFAHSEQYAAAVEIYESVELALRERFFPRAPEFYRLAVEGLVRESLAQGDYEIRMNDPGLAWRTFHDLLERQPRLVEAWRGLIDAEWRSGALTNDAIDGYVREARRAGGDSLAWYKAGLALSYRPGKWRASIKALERAIELEGVHHNYYRTLGYVLMIEGEAREDREMIVRAQSAFDRSLSLLDREARPRDYGRLLINRAYAAHLLQNPRRAMAAYRELFRLGVPFDDEETEYRARLIHGVSLFRSSRPAEAAEQFLEAGYILEALRNMGRVGDEDARILETELLDRRALALFDSGRNAEAAELFARVAARQPEGSLSRVRALRTRGFALLRQAEELTGAAAEAYRDPAAAALHEALAILSSRGFRDDRGAGGRRGGALFRFSSQIAAGDGPAALQDVDPGAEERLIRAALAAIDIDRGNVRAAAERLALQLDERVRAPQSARAYEATVRAITADRLAVLRLRLGDVDGAAEAMVRTVEAARYEVDGDEWVVGPAVSTALLRLAETTRLHGPQVLDAGRLGGLWLAPPDKDAPRDPLRLLDACVAEALARRVPLSENRAVARPLFRARLLLARALVAEQLSAVETGDGVGLLRAAQDSARADTLARQAIALATEATEGGEIQRLAVLAHGVRIRTALASGDPAALEEAREAAIEFAGRTGFGAMRWWVEAQSAPPGSAPPAVAAAAARALAELEDIAPGMASGAGQPDWDELARLAAAHVSESLEDEDREAAWGRAGRWRAAVLRLALDAAVPAPLPTNPEDGEWLEAALGARGAARAALERWRRTNLLVPEDEARRAFEATRARWLRVLAEGRSADLPSARFFDPRPGSFPDASVLVGGLAIPGGSALELVVPGGSASWRTTAGESAPSTSFVFDPVGVHQTEAPEDINLLSVESGVRSMESLRVEAGPELALAWLASPSGGAWDGEPFAGADARFDAPVIASEDDPFGWRLGEGGATLGEALADLRDPMRVSFSTVDGPDSPHAVARALALAAVAERQGAAEARVDGSRWIGRLFPAELVRDAAETEAMQNIAAVQEMVAGGDLAAAVGPLRRVAQLQQAVGIDDATVDETKLYLAQVLADLGRAGEAAETAASTLRHDAPATTARHARNLQLFASYAADAGLADEAVAAYREAAGLAQQEGDPLRAAELLGRAGVAVENVGRYDEAAALYREALDHAPADAAAFRAGQWRRIGRVRLNRQSDFAAAESAFQSALAVASAGDAASESLLAALDLARVDERYGRYDAAVRVARDVAARARDHGMAQVETDAVLLEAFVSWARGDYLEAFRLQGDGLALARDLGDVPLQIIAHNTGALVAWALNDEARALRSLDTALELAVGRVLRSERASTLNNRGLVHRSNGRYSAALVDFAAARDLDRAAGNDWGLAYALRNIGQTHIEAGTARLAAPPLEEAFEIASRIGDRTNRAKTLLALGDAAFLGTEETGRARGLYTEALDEARAIPLPEVEWRALFGLGRIERAAGNLGAARERLDESTRVIESLRARIRVQELQDGFLLDKQEVYDALVEVALEQGDGRGAFAASERSRARGLIDLVANGGAELGSGVDREAVDELEALQAEIERLAREAAVDGADPGADGELERARQDYRDRWLALRARNPELAGFVQVDPATPEEIQAALDPGTALVAYHLLDGDAVAWVLTGSDLVSVRLGAGRADIRGAVADYRAEMQSFGNVERSGDKLGAVLVDPVLPLVAGAERVGIAPHRELHGLPFAALPAGEGMMLVERMALFNLPSASIFPLAKARRPATGEAAGLRVLALGNPDLVEEALALPFAEKEAERLALQLPGTVLLTGTRATETAVADSGNAFDILHLATHGEFDPALPLLSSIRLARDAEHDGILTAREVFGLPLGVDMVALSACQSGLGRISNGDDVVGLNMAFFTAGARQVLATLWRVDDVSTAILVKHFYREVEGTDRAEALRRAQLEVRRTRPHPAHWAGITLTGDWR